MPVLFPRRIKVLIAYDGTAYHGWQVQPGVATVQSAIETALAGIEGKTIHVTASGRTDAGVHALAQVAAFDLSNPIPVLNLRRALNRVLPPDIRILQAAEATPDFHPRHHALAKTYEYRIWRTEVRPPFERMYTHHHPYPLDVPAMAAAAQVLEGTHDFSAFAAADPADALGRSKVRTIFSTILHEQGPRLLFRVRGSGFLKHMVRNLMGTLLEVGKKNLTMTDMEMFLRPGFPHKAGPRAPASGLFLVNVEYETGFPEEAAEPGRTPGGA
ncbi:MAG: tRNA pseudouridine(38-40) synthase TruA [Bryobacteraceae bacterium]